MMTFKEFEALAKEYKTVPVYERILSDLLTPISAYMRLSQTSDYAFLLESVEKGTQYSRYSFIGIHPKNILTHKNDATSILENGQAQIVSDPYLDVLREITRQYKTPILQDIPKFTGGLVGFLGYETIKWIEDIPTYPADRQDIPDALFMLFEDILAFDHLKNETIVISNVNVTGTSNLKELYNRARKRIDHLGESLHSDINYQSPEKGESSEVKSNMTQDDFESAVKRAKYYIEAGDIFQVVLSQCFHRKTSADPMTIYRALRTINPSPYMFHLKLKDFDIIGASPELLVKVEDQTVEIRPIAGTRQRGKTVEDDQTLADELLSDEKEKAEHLMLVDLGRNDVGKVSEYGSVNVEEFMKVENYSHVMHIVSNIKGKLKDGLDSLDALMSGFPAGTLSGAPKIRAMEIIHELEPTRRNIYSGAVGYIEFSGDMNTCIAIRTMLIKDGIVYFQSGAGIVYDSEPTKEYDETVNKAKAIMAALDLAENGLVK